MNSDQAKGNLKQMMGSFKAKWGKLTDDEITESEGNKDYFVGKIQEHYGKSKEAATEEVNSFFQSFNTKNKSEDQGRYV